MYCCFKQSWILAFLVYDILIRIKCFVFIPIWPVRKDTCSLHISIYIRKQLDLFPIIEQYSESFENNIDDSKFKFQVSSEYLRIKSTPRYRLYVRITIDQYVRQIQFTNIISSKPFGRSVWIRVYVSKKLLVYCKIPILINRFHFTSLFTNT